MTPGYVNWQITNASGNEFNFLSKLSSYIIPLRHLKNPLWSITHPILTIAALYPTHQTNKSFHSIHICSHTTYILIPDWFFLFILFFSSSQVLILGLPQTIWKLLADHDKSNSAHNQDNLCQFGQSYLVGSIPPLPSTAGVLWDVTWVCGAGERCWIKVLASPTNIIQELKTSKICKTQIERVQMANFDVSQISTSYKYINFQILPNLNPNTFHILIKIIWVMSILSRLFPLMFWFFLARSTKKLGSNYSSVV